MKALFQAHSCASNPISAAFTLPDGCPLPLFIIGQRVLWIDEYSTFKHQVLGTICGFEYVDHPDLMSGWSYILSVEDSTVTYPDGNVRHLTTSTFETAPEHQVTAIPQCSLASVKVAV